MRFSFKLTREPKLVTPHDLILAEELTKLVYRSEIMTASIKDLENTIAKLADSTGKLVSTVTSQTSQIASLTAQIADLQAKGDVDLSGPVTELQSLDATITAAIPAEPVATDAPAADAPVAAVNSATVS